MTYFCFLCNKYHDDPPTEEHFIPRSINGPEGQWLPVCEASNIRSNSIFDSDVRDILYMARYQNTNILKRTGEALLSDGTLKKYKFSYNEPQALKSDNAFHYFFDSESNKRIPSSSVYAIKFSVGLNWIERETFCRGLAKISIGSLVYLLTEKGIRGRKIKRLFSQTSIDSMRRFALKLPESGNPVSLRFSLGRTDILSRLQRSCEHTLTSNHVIEVDFREKENIRIEGMLYSKYGWQLDLTNKVFFDVGVLRLENTICDMPVPKHLRDLTLSPDSIVVINPDYRGQKPTIPRSWENIT